MEKVIPKCVSFEDYRKNSWHDICKMLGKEEDRCHEVKSKLTDWRLELGNIEVLDSCNDIIYNDVTRLPPPLEPKECLIPSLDPATADFGVIPNWWKARVLEEAVITLRNTDRAYSPTCLGNNYIMPSSLAPVVHFQHNMVTDTIPPPTAFREDSCAHKEDARDKDLEMDRIHGSDSDIVEIKRPGTVVLPQQESESGLAYPLMSLNIIRGESTALSGLNELHSKQRMRSGLFELPEIYSPPPLPPLSPRQKLTLPSPRSSQLEGIMPSFVENNMNLSEQSSSPRMAHSEPTLKSISKRNTENLRSPRPDTAAYRRNKVKTPFSTSLGSVEQKVRINQEYSLGQSASHDSSFGTAGQSKSDNSHHQHNRNSSLSSRRHVLMHEHKSDPHPNGINKTENVRGGAGDSIPSHNYVSPRTRISTHLQPSVITPAMAEAILNECVSSLKSVNWEDNFEAFSQIYSLTEIHPTRVKNVLNKIIWYGLPHLTSSRTKLARMSCLCFKRLFQTQRKSMEIEGEKVFYKLLDLCGAMSNSFIQQECKESLIAAVEHMDALKSITFLELHGSKHKNPHVREFAAYLLNAIMDELPTSKLMNKEFSPRIIPMIVGFLKEGLLQTRLNAKLALDKIFDHSTFESKLRRFVSPENVRHVAETLREFRERRNGHV